MDLKALQRRLAELFLERDRQRGLERTFMKLVEEVGELSEALLGEGSVEEELADVIARSISIANLLGLDVEEILIKKYPELSLRKLLGEL